MIQDHGGTIEVQSEPGQGATFVIELPLAEHAAVAAAPPTVDELPTISGKHVLVIDDEAEIAQMLAEILMQGGHRVDLASNGAEALNLVAASSDYDLILTDTKMPALDGVGFYRELSIRFPELCHRIIFLTGDVLDRAKRDFLESTGAPFLMKPFDVQDVRRLIHRMMTVVEQGR
ncbi:MAG: hypothetical protein DMD91_02240 [Candidatus Rokuibacteriota bacterium]|nr:MAG: hypothetical protein DMD91_02240 [Candidatus Rokubacteria bacterium]